MCRIKCWLPALAILIAPPASAQISPGALSRAHQDLEGPTKCATCHNFGLGERGFKCMDCHLEIKKRVDGKRGYHARAFYAASGSVDCARCHLEHNGRQFQITRIDKGKFDHAGLTDFSLLGKHKTLVCEACHNPAHLEAVARAEIKIKDVHRTFLGLGTQCTSCHADPHAGQLGSQCVNCHSQDAWKPAAGFDHSRSAFALTGRHQNVECRKCHTSSAANPAPHYKGLSFSGCQSCHMDPHRGAFQDATFRGSCESCHVTAGWKSVRAESGFDHQRTKFPLKGKHAELDCLKCHKSSDFRQAIAHERCSDCHEDAHRGQFNGRSLGNDCSACHSETRFKPSLFTREEHQRSAFPLQGKHSAIECVQCHKPEGKEAHYKLGTSTCVGCHTDPHAGQFQAAPHENRCEICHTQDTFRPSTFTLVRHGQTRFALAGAHAAVICADCHHSFPAAASAAARQYHFSELACTSCHADPHRTKESCETCHNLRQWKELRTFNHSATRFPLEGAHQTVICIACHRATPAAVTAKIQSLPDFLQTPRECLGCHEDVHGGQFLSAGREEDCSSCHTVTHWSTASFDHSKTKFPLDGAHQKVKCSQCHTRQEERPDRQIRIYRGTATRCRDCHATYSK